MEKLTQEQVFNELCKAYSRFLGLKDSYESCGYDTPFLGFNTWLYQYDRDLYDQQ